MSIQKNCVDGLGWKRAAYINIKPLYNLHLIPFLPSFTEQKKVLNKQHYGKAHLNQ